MLEEESIFWVDDLDLAASMVIKTIKTIKEGDEDVSFSRCGETMTTTKPLWRICSLKRLLKGNKVKR